MDLRSSLGFCEGTLEPSVLVDLSIRKELAYLAILESVVRRRHGGYNATRRDLEMTTSSTVQTTEMRSANIC